MKTIAVADSLVQEKFKSYLSGIFSLLEIDCCLYELTRDEYLDYIIINSPTYKSDQLSAEYCLVNMDNDYNKGMSLCGAMITYGFGNKNTITISSVGDSNQGFVFCLQRYLKLNSSYTLEPQEIPIHLQFDNDIELYAFMAAITIGLIEGKDSSLIQKKLNKKILTLI